MAKNSYFPKETRIVGQNDREQVGRYAIMSLEVGITGISYVVYGNERV